MKHSGNKYILLNTEEDARRFMYAYKTVKTLIYESTSVNEIDTCVMSECSFHRDGAEACGNTR